MAQAARDAWNRELATVQVRGGSNAERRAFYTALYHAYQHPNVEMDVDRRYLGMDGKPHVAVDHTHYANFSSWDTYKAQNQLLATLQPERYRDMLLSLLNAARLGGKLPRWGEHSFDASHMSGDPAIPMIVDGVCRGIFATDDPRVARPLRRHDRPHPTPPRRAGRPGLPTRRPVRQRRGDHARVRRGRLRPGAGGRPAR